MIMKTIDKNILSTANAMQNCIEHDDQTKANWYDIHQDRITETLLAALPHGSGINCKWNFDFTDKLIVCNNSYHRMGENGMYCGYIDFEIRIKISHRDIDGKLDFSIVGRFERFQDIKDYLYEIIDYGLENL